MRMSRGRMTAVHTEQIETIILGVLKSADRRSAGAAAKTAARKIGITNILDLSEIATYAEEEWLAANPHATRDQRKY